ncbi:barstar family protein [Hymenobacter sp. ASUV-10]|uniref:Barstar family protein n=1 Tax=Hymenobacter aranciens TaxID=3063996 RepID=A0ABT9B7H0_9BACT|nr:barstar family protein [Hymenobacter sp. ASUV-10]MDO7874221.1 barstar family protein [Hymenobacter sp. ASUV-10]
MTIDLTGITTHDAFHKLLKQHLAFPDWYGANWDAFWDTVTALIEMPDYLILEHWEEFAQACPRDMQILRELIAEYHREFPEKQIILG